MDFGQELTRVRRLKNLAFEARLPGGNNLLHQFVLDNCFPNASGSEGYFRAVLRSIVGCTTEGDLSYYGECALRLAAQKGNHLMVKALLSCIPYIDVDARNEFEETALHLAAASGHSSVVRELLRMNADPYLKDNHCNNALCIAVVCPDLDMVKLLVDQGVDVNSGGPLHAAARRGNIAMIQFLLSAGANLNARLEITGQTPLHCAAMYHKLETVKYLINAGADPSARDGRGRTTLHHVYDAKIVEYLLNSGVDLSAADAHGWTALHYAAASGGSINTKFPYCVDTDVSAENMDFFTLQWCHGAAYMVLQFLLCQGADTNALNELGETPLHVAVKWGCVLSVELLLYQGADPNVTDRDGRTPLHLAVEIESLKIFCTLLDHGADLNAQDRWGRTPLQIALYNESVTVPEMLIERGCNVDAANSFGMTALHVAVHIGCGRSVRLLLDGGADRNARDGNGRTPLDVAKELKKHSCIEVFQKIR